MKAVEVKNDHCTITINPNPRIKLGDQIELAFRNKGDNCRNVITLYKEDLNYLQQVIRKFKRENWWELTRKKEINNGS